MKQLQIEMADGKPYVEPPMLGNLTPTAGQARAIDAGVELMKQQGPGGLIIVGYAGVGKTTLLKAFGQLFPGPTVITPTGKAALRVTEATGLKAQTAHRWLYHVGEGGGGQLQFQVKGPDKLVLPLNRLVLIDEASMIGRSLWADIWRTAQRYGLKIIAVGDGFQLPPVADKGSVEAFSMLEPRFAAQHNFHRVELTEILRQAEDSPIIRASMGLRRNEGVAAVTANIPRVKPMEFDEACAQCFGMGGVIISHANATRFKVNARMRANYGLTWPVEGEPLMLLRNNYTLDIYNGEQLTFESWVKAPAEEDVTVVKDRYTHTEGPFHFGAAVVSGHTVVLAYEELTGQTQEVGGAAILDAGNRWAKENRIVAHGDFAPCISANYGYCYTAHKAQGSEWPSAFVLLEGSVKLRDEEGRRWAYTALTRARATAAVYMDRIP